MNKFFPVGATSTTALTSSAVTALPSGGPLLRIARETSSVRVFIAFGANSITATLASMELVSGVVEELESPNQNL